MDKFTKASFVVLDVNYVLTYIKNYSNIIYLVLLFFLYIFALYRQND